MLPHELSCPKGRLLLSILMLEDAGRNCYAVAGVHQVVSQNPGISLMMGTKPSLATCTTFCESVTPSKRRTAAYIALCYLLLKRGRDPLGPRLALINVPSVKG